MARRAINTLAGIWLVFCVGTASLWAAGHYERTLVPRHLMGRWYYVIVGPFVGNISIGFLHDFPMPNVGPKFGPGRTYTPALLNWYDRVPPGFYRRFWGFGIEDDPNFEIDAANHFLVRGKRMGFSIPYWAASVMWIPLLIFADIRLKQRARRGRTAKGLCPICGYDLRATPDRCPECGAIPPKDEIMRN